MAQALEDWVATDVAPLRDKPLGFLSQHHFFRDPTRPIYADPSVFFSPADGVILYQRTVGPAEPIVDIKGRPYSLREALRDDSFDTPSLVIGIFMTFFDVHVNRAPFPGRLSWKLLDPIETYNRPMIEVEKGLLDDLRINLDEAAYVHSNQRMVNRVDSPLLGLSYYVLQIADYDVDSITPFELRQRQPVDQGHRFSMIRYGSQVELIVPLDDRLELETVQPTGYHVQAGVDPLIRVKDVQAQGGTP
jgi:phosphatidylserine decarboxylase